MKFENWRSISTFTKYDSKKLRLSLLPFKAVEEIAEELQYGSEKYDDDNWRKCDDLSRYQDAALRHLFAAFQGERLDSESGKTHLAHAACCVMFLMELDGEPDEV